MTGKQRAYLRGLANGVQSKYQIGKGGYDDPNFITQIKEGLEKNEIIKITVLENASLSPREVSDELCKIVGAEGIQAIGNKIVLYKESEKHKKIILPR